MGILRATAAFLVVLTLQAQPHRIVSTFPSITETIFALGAGDRVVGVSQYCRFPPAVLSLPKVGTYTKPDPEKIALLRPDLVFIQKTASSLADRLTSLGIRYVQVKVGSLADVYSMIGQIGQAIGADEKAAKLNTDIGLRLEELHARNRPHTSVLIVVGRTPGLLTNLVAVGSGTYLGELLEIAGGTNVLSGAALAYPRISLETVVRLNPDVILDASMMSEVGTDLRQPWLEHSELAAVRNGRVFGLSSEIVATPGPRVVDAVRLIQEKLKR